MRTAFLLAALAASTYALTDGYDVTYTVDGDAEIEDVVNDYDIAEVSKTYYESLARSDGTTDENGEVYLADDDVIVWLDGCELSVTSEGGLANGDSLYWYTCSPNDTDSYDCEMITTLLDTATTATTYPIYTFQLAAGYFDDETAELNPYTDRDSVAAAVMTSVSDQDSEAPVQDTDQTSSHTWVETSEWDATTLVGTLSYIKVRELSDTNGVITDWTLLDLTEFEPSSPCYDLEGAEATDFEEIWGVITVSASDGTTQSAWASVAEEAFEELHDVCSGATTLVASAAVAAFAALAF